MTNEIHHRTKEAEDRLTKLEAKQELIYQKLDKIDQRTLETHDELTKYKGGFGMLVFIISSLSIAWGLFGEWVKRHIT